MCPKCGLQASLDASDCLQCGHKYRTQFTQTQNVARTQAFTAGATQPVVAPNTPQTGQPTVRQQAPMAAQQSGHPQQYQPVQQFVSPWITPWPAHSASAAAAFSFFTTIGGQIYNKQYGKATLLFFLTATWFGLAERLAASLPELETAPSSVRVIAFLLRLTFLVPSLVLTIDAYRVGEKVARGYGATPWTWF